MDKSWEAIAHRLSDLRFNIALPLGHAIDIGAWHRHAPMSMDKSMRNLSANFLWL